MELLKDEIAEKRSHMGSKRSHLGKTKVMFRQGIPSCHKLIKTIVKLYKIAFHLGSIEDLAPNEFLLSSNLKIMPVGEKFGDSEEVIQQKRYCFEKER